VRIFLVAAVLLALTMVGVVVTSDRGRSHRSRSAPVDEGAEVATIARGERVDIAAFVPRQGLTIVEFTADF
jgi:hypothetical protein